MKNKTIILLATLILFSSFVLGASSTCNLNVSLINQDPYPAVPGEYVDVVFQVSNVDNPDCEGANFNLIPTYPFSLDNNDGLRKIEGSTWITGSNTEWMIPFKMRVDKDAIDGQNQIEVQYWPNTWNAGSYSTEKFDIALENPRTNFEAVVQEVSGTDVSIALANTGKYAANSVIVRIPSQEGFTPIGTDGQMVGNLESGDYTIVGFSLKEKDSSQPLKLDIHYTDMIGQRRTVSLELPLSLTSTIPSFSELNAPKKSSWLSWQLVLIVLVLVILLVVIKKYYKKILKIKK